MTTVISGRPARCLAYRFTALAGSGQGAPLARALPAAELVAFLAHALRAQRAPWDS
jgi:hypothetical protein